LHIAYGSAPLHPSPPGLHPSSQLGAESGGSSGDNMKPKLKLKP
jgi:hypothetical protein